jgi:hypothetical protein
MKFKLLIAVCIVFLAILLIKTQNQNETKAEFSNNSDCLYQDNSSKLKTIFPFSEADKIEVVAFGFDIEARVRIKNDVFQLMAVPRMGDTTSKKNRNITLKDIKVLNEQEVKMLFSILFDYQTPDGNSVAAGCYEPHHAILFYKEDKAIDFLELCFHCRNYSNSEKDSFKGFCLETYNRLEGFVSATGIETDKVIWQIKKRKNKKYSKQISVPI